MSSTDSRTVDPAQPHHSENGGHEMSDFSWSRILWFLPLSVIILLVFFAVCIAWFKGAKDSELETKQAAFVTTELNQHLAKENEILTQYKIIDKNTGRFQIPVARAMELIVQENQNKPGKAWTPTTDSYLEGAAFATKAKPASEAGVPAAGIPVERDVASDAHATEAVPAKVHGDGKDKAHTGKSAHEKAH